MEKQKSNGKKALVTGITGQDGAYLAEVRYSTQHGLITFMKTRITPTSPDSPLWQYD
jgi:GDP-D-mannose dehydratase